MKHLDLFSGIGGFALAARWVGWETVGFCERDSYCQKVLAKNFPGVPIYGDIHRFHKYDFDSYSDVITEVQIVTAGFPCQPYSHSGQQKGRDDDRHLWPELFRVLSEIKPRYFLGENVPGIIGMELDNVLSDLEDIGYTTGTIIVPACAVDAGHRRDRVWILADTNSEPEQRRVNGCRGEGEVKATSTGTLHVSHESSRTDVAHDSCSRSKARVSRQKQRQEGNAGKPDNSGGERCRRSQPGKWLPEPGMDRVVDGIPNRTHRLRGLGNAIVPQVAEVIFRAINEINRRG